MALTAMALTAAPATAGATACGQACQERVKQREFVKRYGGCYSRICVQRVRAKRVARETRRLTPYECSFGRSAIPCAIVMCESHGRWTAHNPSGAIGRYQLLGKGAPWPANTSARRLEHHRIAARLWAGGRGARHWAQCLP